jgi:hypothetical protein
MWFDCHSLWLYIFIPTSLLAAHLLSQACYSYTLPASLAHFRYIRPVYFVARISVISLILSALHSFRYITHNLRITRVIAVMDKVCDIKYSSSKLKIPQVNPVTRPAHDPEKQGACATSSHDLVPCDHTRNKSPNMLCALTCDKLWELICFRKATSPKTDALLPSEHMVKLLTMGKQCNCGPDWFCLPHNACFIHKSCFCEGSGA